MICSFVSKYQFIFLSDYISGKHWSLFIWRLPISPHCVWNHWQCHILLCVTEFPILYYIFTFIYWFSW